MEIRKAGFEDMEQIRDLIKFYAGKNMLLPRSLSYLYENIRDYTVAVKDDLILGCCSLHVCWDKVGEVKSLAVDPRHIKKGIGAKLLNECLQEARQIGVEKVFTLTLKTGFFEKQGFKQVDKETLPMKIWGECATCPKYPDCDEKALTKKI